MCGQAAPAKWSTSVFTKRCSGFSTSSLPPTLAPALSVSGKGAGTRNSCPHGHFPTGDGKWIAIACTTDKMFARLARAMERPDLVTTYGLQERRLAARDTVDRLVAAWSGRLTQAEAMACCLA